MRFRRMRCAGVALALACIVRVGASQDCALPQGFKDTPHPEVAPVEQLVSHTEEIVVAKPLDRVLSESQQTPLKQAIKKKRLPARSCRRASAHWWRVRPSRIAQTSLPHRRHKHRGTGTVAESIEGSCRIQVCGVELHNRKGEADPLWRWRFCMDRSWQRNNTGEMDILLSVETRPISRRTGRIRRLAVSGDLPGQRLCSDDASHPGEIVMLRVSH